MGKFGAKMLWLLGGLIIYLTATEGNTGKLLACIFTPGTLEVDLNTGQDQSNSGPSQPG